MGKLTTIKKYNAELGFYGISFFTVLELIYPAFGTGH